MNILNNPITLIILAIAFAAFVANWVFLKRIRDVLKKNNSAIPGISFETVNTMWIINILLTLLTGFGIIFWLILFIITNKQTITEKKSETETLV